MTVSFKSRSQERLYDAVVTGLGRLGYRGDLIAREYVFPDYFVQNTPERKIKAAAFGQLPVSYETALFGVALENGAAGKELVKEYRALCAPILFEIGEQSVAEWAVGSDDQTTKLHGRFALDELSDRFEKQASLWSPATFLRVKTTGQERWRYQHELFAGLVPELEGQIQKKLDPRLRAAVQSAQHEYQRSEGRSASEQQLFAAAFRLLTGKVFRDREHPEFRDLTKDDGPDVVLARVAEHYRQPAEYPLTEAARWEVFRHIWSQLDFRNLSVEVLSQLWLNTLISRETRKKLGIYRTRKSIVQYVLDRIPFDDFPKDERRVLEPCCGSATFLVAAMERLREFQPEMTDPAEQHDYFQRMLVGYEYDPFGYEISQLCLSLADYPNHDGWQVKPENVFTSASFRRDLSEARVVLCNPPFKRFSRMDRQENRATLWEPPAELLDRVLSDLHPRGVIGFVLPRPFIDGKFYASVREKLAHRFDQLEIVRLADKGWEHADPETALLIATKPNHVDGATVSFGIVREDDWQDFDWFGAVGYRDTEHRDPAQARESLLVPELKSVWEYLRHLPKLGDVAKGAHALRWKLKLTDNWDTLVKEQPATGYRVGVRPQPDLYSFQKPETAYLSFLPEHQKYDAFSKVPWDRPKVLVNKIAKERGPWRFAAFADFEGLACSETLYPVFPKQPKLTVVIAVILNGPVANAFATAHSGKRETTLDTLHKIPVPTLSRSQVGKLERLVTRYQRAVESASYKEADRVLRKIDAIILDAYELPPRLERQLLDYFNGYHRQVPFPFGDYFPPDFNPCYSLSEYLSPRFSEATAGEFLKRYDDYIKRNNG